MSFSASLIAGTPFSLTQEAGVPNGAWCWFQDERAIIDTDAPGGPLLLVSTVSFGGEHHGDTDLLWKNLRSGEAGHVTLHAQLEADDHDMAALLVRPDGRYLAMYSKHSADRLMRYRISERPGDPTAWGEEQTVDTGANACYANLHWADAERKVLYDFSRTRNIQPNLLVSRDMGETWSDGGKVFRSTRADRPYVKYASRRGRIDFITTDGHPRIVDDGIFHGYLEHGVLHRSDGTEVGPLAREPESPYAAPDFTPLMSRAQRFGGVAMHRAWTSDLHLDADGHPYAGFSARAENLDLDHRFFYSRYDAQGWNTYEIAPAGPFLYEPENDYTGLVALHPHDPDTVFISTLIDPRDDAQLEHYELFRGHTSDRGAHFTWTPVTWNSAEDNLRPVVCIWPGDTTALLWLRGSLEDFSNWNSQVAVVLTDTAALGTFGVEGQPSVERAAIPPDPPAPPRPELSTDLTPTAIAAAAQRHATLILDRTAERSDTALHPVDRLGLGELARTLSDDALAQRVADAEGGDLDPVTALYWLRAPDTTDAQLEQARTLLGDVKATALPHCGLLLAQPATLAALGHRTDDAQLTARAVETWQATTAALWDENKHWYRRGNRDRFSRPHLPGGRDNGRAITGLAFLLQALPPEHPERRQLETQFKTFASALLAAPVAAAGGAWPSNLQTPWHGDIADAEATGFTLYALTWGMNQGLLDTPTFADSVEEGWSALVGLEPEAPAAAGAYALAAAELYRRAIS